MKKVFLAFCCGAGGALIGFWANSLDTVVGCVCFSLGVVLLVGALAAMSKENQKDGEAK